MKAVAINAYGGPEQLKFEELPDPMAGAGDVLVRVAAASVNPFDLKLRSGAFKEFFPLTFPAILGVDIAGIVEAVGAGVQNFAPGDRVFANAMQTYASLCVVKAPALARIPDRIDVIDAAAIPTVTMTGAQLAELAIRGKQPGIVLVTGAAGNVGRSSVFTAKRSGWVVIAAVRKKQVDEAKAAGADRVIALDEEASMKSLEPLDAVADTISGPVADQLISKVKKGGTFASVLAAPSNAAAYPEVKVETMQVEPDAATLVRMAEAVRDGKLVIPLGQRFALADASEAHLAAEKGTAGKLLLVA